MKCERCGLIYDRALATYGPRDTLYWVGYCPDNERREQWLALVVAKENEFKLGDAQIIPRLRARLASNHWSAYRRLWPLSRYDICSHTLTNGHHL